MCRRASFPVEQHFTRAEQRSSIIAQEYDVFIITQDFFLLPSSCLKLLSALFFLFSVTRSLLPNLSRTCLDYSLLFYNAQYFPDCTYKFMIYSNK